LRGTHPTDLPPVAPYLGGKGTLKQARRPAERLLIINAVHVGLTATPMIAANVMDFVIWHCRLPSLLSYRGSVDSSALAQVIADGIGTLRPIGRLHKRNGASGRPRKGRTLAPTVPRWSIAIGWS